MQITFFDRDTDALSHGVISGEGKSFRFVAANATGRIELWQEEYEGEWLTVVGPPPLHLQRLVAVKLADEMWKRGVGPAMPTVVIGAEPAW